MKNSNSPIQSRYCDCTIQLQKADSKRLLDDLEFCIDDLCYNFSFQVAYCVHDKDVKEDGSKVGLHVHIVIFGDKNTKLRKNEWLKDVYLSFSTLVEKDAINVDTIGAVLLPKKVKYLLHWNAEDKSGDKHIYELSELHTYSYEKGFYDYVQSLLFAENKKDSDGAILLAQFKDAVESSNSLTEVIYKVGIVNYRSWRWVITDLWKEELTSRACGDK